MGLAQIRYSMSTMHIVHAQPGETYLVLCSAATTGEGGNATVENSGDCQTTCITDPAVPCVI